MNINYSSYSLEELYSIRSNIEKKLEVFEANEEDPDGDINRDYELRVEITNGYAHDLMMINEAIIEKMTE